MANLILKQRIAQLGLPGRSALLFLVFAALWILSIPVALVVSGPISVFTSLAAAAVVGFASILGMAFGEMFHGPNEAITKLLFGMIIRMAIPLVACLLVLATGSPLMNTGFVFYVLAFYMAALPIDTMLSLAQQPNQKLAGGN